MIQDGRDAKSSGGALENDLSLAYSFIVIISFTESSGSLHWFEITSFDTVTVHTTKV